MEKFQSLEWGTCVSRVMAVSSVMGVVVRYHVKNVRYKNSSALYVLLCLPLLPLDMLDFILSDIRCAKIYLLVEMTEDEMLFGTHRYDLCICCHKIITKNVLLKI
jgi:hypothetical protein